MHSNDARNDWRNLRLEPGVGFILAVSVAEALFEDAAFGAGAQDLHGNYDEEEPRVLRAVEVEQQASEEKDAEDVDGVANAGVDAGGDEFVGLGTNGEGVAELQAGDSECGAGSQHHEQPKNTERGPRRRGEIYQEQCDRYERNDGNEESAAFHAEDS